MKLTKTRDVSEEMYFGFARVGSLNEKGSDILALGNDDIEDEYDKDYKDMLGYIAALKKGGHDDFVAGVYEPIVISTASDQEERKLEQEEMEQESKRKQEELERQVEETRAQNDNLSKTIDEMNKRMEELKAAAESSTSLNAAEDILNKTSQDTQTPVGNAGSAQPTDGDENTTPEGGLNC